MNPPAAQTQAPQLLPVKGKLLLGTFTRHFHVASFPKTDPIKTQTPLTRAEFQDRSKKFKYNKFLAKGNRTRISFEEKPDETQRIADLKEKIPWKIELPASTTVNPRMPNSNNPGQPQPTPSNLNPAQPAKVVYDGKFDDSRTHRYIMLVPNGNDFRLYLCDKWYNFEIPPKAPTLTSEQMEAKFKKDRTRTFITKASGGKGEENDKDEGDSNANYQEEDSFEPQDGDDGGGREENDWDFEEQFDDDVDVDQGGDYRTAEDEKIDKLFDNPEDEEQEQERKSEKQEMNQLLKLLNEKSANDDLTYEMESEEDDDKEFQDEDDEDDEEEQANGNGNNPNPLNPASSSSSTSTPTSTSSPAPPHGEKRKGEDGTTQMTKKQKLAERQAAALNIINDPNLLTVEEVKKFLIQPSTVKELGEKFKTRLREDERNKQQLTNILKNIANLVGDKLILKTGS